MKCTHDSALLLDYLDGALDDAQEASLLRHLADCPDCRRYLASLHETEAGLAELAQAPPPTDAIQRVQRRVRQERGMGRQREILTLPEAADFLRLTPDELATVLDDLPWFELAGQIRFRRQALLDWIRRRERECTRERLGRSMQREFRSIA